MIKTPYLLFLGDARDLLAAKVAQGIKDWRPGFAVGQFRIAGCKADMGLADMTLDQARAGGAKTLVIGVANRGGVISPEWRHLLAEALLKGFDLASGLHSLLVDEPELVEIAREEGRAMHDVRGPPVASAIANGQKRRGRRCLAVGTDRSVGKMYTALSMDAEMKRRGLKATFRATGQTGILITGDGMPLDAVVADFMAGAVEWLTPDSDDDHWDLIEGQGSLFHPSYSGVTMALIHGGQPDALILCHEPAREHMRGLPDCRLPSLEALRDRACTRAARVNPLVRVIGVSVNTQHMTETGAPAYLAGVGAETRLPAVDPFRHGSGKLVDALVALG